MIKKAGLVITAFILFVNSLTAQTTYLPLNTEDYHTLDRLETRSGRLSDSLFLSTKPTMRNRAVQFLEQQRENARFIGLNATDRYNINQLISENGEWTKDEEGAMDSKHPWFNTFYKKQYDFIYVHKNDFFLVVNPIISAEVYNESNNTRGTLYWSSRGFEARGWISKRISFYTSATDNQERDVSFVNSWVESHHAVPGANYYFAYASGYYDYLLASGYFDFAIIKDHINASFGYDKQFIGDGLTSMFLSDFAASEPFLKINTRIWHINYENLYMELTPQFAGSPDHLLPHKYCTIQHLSFNATKWLNLGLFESIIFDRRDHFEFRYLNPIIFLGELEQSLGSPDKKHIGIDFKIVAAHHLQFYGQFLLDEFKASSFFSNNGWWGNKWALQLGGKYFDAFTVKNLDLQLELNVVRPYTYTHNDSIANYTHYNQPLATPLGANFIQLIGVAKYQVFKKLFLTAKGMYYTQGADTGSSDYGSNIFASYDLRSGDYGIKLLNGIKTNCMLLNFNISYQLKPNLFIDLGATHRSFTSENTAIPNVSTTYMYGGFRLNIARRDFDFY